MWRVDPSWRSDEIGDVVEVAVRCLPAWTRRMSVVGADVRRERSWRRVGMVVSTGMMRGMAAILLASGVVRRGEEGLLSPERSLTNIWMFSDGVEDVEVEEAFEDDLEVRMIAEVIGRDGR